MAVKVVMVCPFPHACMCIGRAKVVFMLSKDEILHENKPFLVSASVALLR